jgi:signal transduction histidine kinase/CheY-like chemotaxis protein
VYLEALFLAIAIALRIRGMRAEAFAAQQKLNESLRFQLEESQRAQRLSEERSWALQDLSEKGRLLLGAGHDSRQMLSALRNYAAGLRRGAQDASVIQASHGIDEIARSLREVLSSVVAGSGSGGMADHALALDTLSASSLMGPLQLIHGRDASEKGIDLRVHLSDRMLVTDRVLAMRVLSNLLSNAIKYTEAGRVVVALRPRGRGVRFQIWDTGTGLDAESLGILLDPDAGALRLDEREQGTGSGLGIAKRVAARLGGLITARSTPGHGSVFQLELPQSSGQGAAARGGTTLLFHRESDRFAHLERSERGAGRSFFCAETPDDAQRLFEEHAQSCDLIVIDQHLGGVDGGIRFAREIRAAAPAVDVVLLSYDRSTEARARMTEVVQLVLYKPVSAQAFDAARRHLRGPEGGAPGARASQI